MALPLLAGMVFVSGCATVIKGTTQPIPIASDPAGARVNVDGKPCGTTPTTVTMDRKHSHMVSLDLPGYEVENVAVTNSVGGAVAGNIILGGLVGWGVDATSGAQYNLHPDTINVRLRRATASGEPVLLATSLATELAKLEDMRRRGALSEDEYTKMRSALIASFEGQPAEKIDARATP